MSMQSVDDNLCNEHWSVLQRLHTVCGICVESRSERQYSSLAPERGCTNIGARWLRRLLLEVTAKVDQQAKYLSPFDML